MERNLYNAFYKYTNCIWLSEILAKAAYAVYVFIYKVNRLIRSKQDIVVLDEKEAEKQVGLISPKPDIRFEWEQTECDEDMDLSVIVPVYNYAAVLENCLNSIVGQETKYNYEMFFVDDGSTDGSGEILKKYEKLQNVHILRQPNQGISAARNLALGKAGGKYIMFVDCDDYLEKTAVETFLTEAYAGNYDIVEAAYYTFEKNAGSGRNFVQKRISLFQNDFEKMAKYTGYPWSKVYKRELFEQIRFPVNSWFEDTIVKMLLFRKCQRYSYLIKPLYGYRKYEGNFTETQVKSVRGIEHYWLLLWLAEFSDSRKIGDKESLYLALLYHLGPIFLYRIDSIQEETKRQAFFLGGKLLERYIPETRKTMKLPYMYKELEQALLKKDYAQWKQVCRRI